MISTDNKVPYEKYLILFVPWGLSVLFKSNLILSYFTAWFGSFFIFFMSLTGNIKPLPTDRSFANQIMRPIIIVQIIFAGYMCCTSIFYVMNLYGYTDFKASLNGFLVDANKLQVTVQCQRYYILGHAAMTTGILLFMDYPEKQKYRVETKDISNLLLVTAVIALPVSLLFATVPGLSQFYYQFNSLSFMAGTLALAFAIPEKKIWNTAICVFLYFTNFYTALLSGFKEPIILSVLVLGIFLYPTYKKVVIITFLPALFLLFVVLPTYAEVFRANAWLGDESSSDASQLALDAALNGSNNEDTNWGFLVYRISEIDMFTEFVQSTPDKVDFYGFKLLGQSVISIIPRIFWPSKPSTEDLVMQRVYDAGVINRNSAVSAKPAFVVDAYLSGGGLGVFLSMLIYGALAQLISLKAEKWFGGYILGTALIFSGLFQIFWRGLSFEFIINTIFWSYVTMYIIFRIMKAINIIKET
jgi:hypothetical protein